MLLLPLVQAGSSGLTVYAVVAAVMLLLETTVLVNWYLTGILIDFSGHCWIYLTKLSCSVIFIHIQYCTGLVSFSLNKTDISYGEQFHLIRFEFYLRTKLIR